MASAPPEAGAPRPALALRGVAKRFATRGGTLEVLADVDFALQPGELVAIVGFSGSGKTTLLSILAGLLHPDAGAVEMDGAPAGGPGPERGVVFQSYALLPWLSALGNVELALHDWDVDFAAWCSYKYLNGGPGATAGAFVHERHFDRRLPRLAGWWGNDLDTRFEMAESFRPYRGAAGWQVSNHPLLGMVPLQASFAQFAEAGIPALRARSVALTGWLERLLDERIGDRMEILSPRDPEARGAQLSVRLRGAPGQGRRLFDRLLASGLTCDWREPDVIRLAPAPMYNSYEDCWRAVELIDGALSA